MSRNRTRSPNPEETTNLYVSNLPPWMDDEALRLAFQFFGLITSAKVMKKHDKVYGFVQFTEPYMATMAMSSMNGHHIGEYQLMVKTADRDKDKGVAAEPSTNVYVGNLPLSFGEEDIQQLFSLCGAISSSVVLTDRRTGRSRGVGLVRFFNLSDAAASIVALNGVVLPGYDRPLEVKYAESGQEKRTRKVKSSRRSPSGSHPPPPILDDFFNEGNEGDFNPPSDDTTPPVGLISAESIPPPLLGVVPWMAGVSTSNNEKVDGAPHSKNHNYQDPNNTQKHSNNVPGSVYVLESSSDKDFLRPQAPTNNNINPKPLDLWWA